MTRRTLILRYALFAVIATIGNLAIQRGVMYFGERAPFFIAAVALGTLVGLVIKYILDKQWIFFDQSTGVKAHSRKFTLYTSMGLVTTAIFWGTETAFWLIWGTEGMRELGAILGLSVGYVVKYDLDRRFVFPNSVMSNVT
ncbi:MAG: GtrA family protein [Pseudomonadota bacterium]